MKRVTFLASAAALIVGVAAGALLAQQTQGSQPFFVGNRLGLPVNPAPDGAFEPISPNVKVYGSIYSAESCSYDAGRGLIVVPNRGVPQNVKRTTPGSRSSTTTDRSIPHAGLAYRIWRNGAT
jgi:hypothetical protein